jgi:hypothetical protein
MVTITVTHAPATFHAWSMLNTRLSFKEQNVAQKYNPKSVGCGFELALALFCTAPTTHLSVLLSPE